MIKSDFACPCSSGKLYSECCQKYHNGIPAENAKALMRSRYSAYALQLADYIIQTTHPKNPAYSTDFDEWKKDILHFSQITSFNKLDVLSFSEEKAFAYVTFTAHLSQGNQDVSFTEKSRFQKLEDKWLYLDGEFLPL